ncbi:MAG TPA: thermosome subunit beta, partial [Nitrososphaeraceae archaeon]
QIPIMLLREGTTETKDKDAQRNNITAAKLVAEVVRSSLGPRGMDKMLVDPMGDVTITNDGATILKEIDVQHPAAKMMVEVSKSVDSEVGDGTTSSVVIAGSLLEKAEELLDKEVHPSVIVDGYKKCSSKACEILRNISTWVRANDKDILSKISRTSMSSKMVSGNSQCLSEIVVESILAAADETDRKIKVDIDNIKVDKKPGGSINDTSLVRGVILDKEVAHAGMPKRVDEAQIALINSPLEIEKTEFDAKISISSPNQMKSFLEEENNILKSMVDKIASTGANVIICQKGIDDIAQHYLAKENILAVRRVKESDMAKLSRASGARIVTNIDELAENDLGYSKLVEERKVENDKWVFIEECKNPKAVSILVRGGSQRVVDEAERSIHDALMCVKDVIEYPYIVTGGGAPEATVALKLREWAGSLPGREQLAAEKFADAMESIPLTLARNAGVDVIDTQVHLRSKTSSVQKPKFGIDVINGEIADMTSKQVYEPLIVKENVLNAATETASMILRIDNVIAASNSKNTPQSGGIPGGAGMPNGMGGY